MKCWWTTPVNRLVIPLSSSFKLPPQGGPRGGSSRSGPPRPCALLVVLRLHRDRARDDALLDGVDVVLQGADVGAALELVVDGALDGRLDRDVHVLLDAGQEQAAVLLRALAAVGVHPDHVLVATGGLDRGGGAQTDRAGDRQDDVGALAQQRLGDALAVVLVGEVTGEQAVLLLRVPA